MKFLNIPNDSDNENSMRRKQDDKNDETKATRWVQAIKPPKVG